MQKIYQDWENWEYIKVITSSFKKIRALSTGSINIVIQDSNTKWEIRSPWMQNRVRCSTGGKRWGLHENCTRLCWETSLQNTSLCGRGPSSLKLLSFFLKSSRAYFGFSFFRNVTFGLCMYQWQCDIVHGSTPGELLKNIVFYLCSGVL